MSKPARPFIVFEKFNKENERTSPSLIIMKDDEPIMIGRGHKCDLRISDISVSRVHAILKLVDRKFLIFDNETKFGTHILLKDNLKIKESKTAIQIGRTVFTLFIKYLKPKFNAKRGPSNERVEDKSDQ